MIIVDTREQKPLWNSKIHEVISQKLDEGDYTTTDLHNVSHIERKSAIDLYGSIIQNHKRFMAELERAKKKNITLVVFVECTRDVFVNKKFKGSYRLKTKSSTLKKIISTLISKHQVVFVWCDDRDDLRRKMLIWFASERQKIKRLKLKNNG